MRIIKLLFYLIFSFQILFANIGKVDSLSSILATPFYNIYNENVIEIIKKYVEENPNVEAVKIFDTMINKPAIVYYKNNGKYNYAIDKDFPKYLKLSNRQSSAKIAKNGKTIGVVTVFYGLKLGEKLLSKDESKYLNDKKIITMCVDPNWLPFEKIVNGKHIGFAADIMKIISKNLNIPIKLIPTSSWQESLDFAKNRDCDILSLASKTPNRSKYMDFSSGYVDIPIVLVTKAKTPFIDDIVQIKDKKLGLVKGYSLYEKLRKKYSDINLVEVDSIKDGLQKVEDGDLFAYLDNSIVLNYEIQRNHMGTLAISGKLEEHFSLRVATRNDEPLLQRIFEKAIKTIEPAQIDEIYKRWVAIKIERIKVTDYSLVYKVIILSVFLLVVFAYWNRKITKTNKELEIAKKKIEILATTDKLTGLYNRAKIEKLLEIEIERSKRFNHNMIVSILDIDYFKSVNDELGHQVGDEVLIEISQLLEKYIRKTDYVGRWGGEEFVIVCPETNVDGGLNMIENLRIKIESHNFSHVGTKTASFGFTLFKKDDRLESLIKRADEGLYEAKESGRNRIVFKP